MNPKRIKILSVTTLVLLAGFGYFFFNSEPKLKGTLKEVPTYSEKVIGYRYYKMLDGKTDIEITADEFNGGNIKSLSDGQQARAVPIVEKTETTLKDNEYIKTGGKNVASTSPEVKVKYPNQSPVVKFENEL